MTVISKMTSASCLTLVVITILILLYVQFILPPKMYTPFLTHAGANSFTNRAAWRPEEEEDMSNLFDMLKAFRKENGYLPVDDNASLIRAMRGENKFNKNYFQHWRSISGDFNVTGPLFNVTGSLLDVGGKPYVFHFVANNEITIICPSTGQQLNGVLDTGSATVTQASAGQEK